MARILVLYYSSYGHTSQMAEAVAEGVRDAGHECDIRRVPETAPPEVAKAAGFSANESHAVIEGADVLAAYDGIAFSGDGTMYINNVRQHTVQRVDRSGGAYAGLATLTLSEPVNGPDALRPVTGNRFLQAEGPGNRVTYVDIEGDRATIVPVRTGLESSPGVTHVGRIGYATEGKINYLFDPALRDKDPGPFIIRAFPLP